MKSYKSQAVLSRKREIIPEFEKWVMFNRWRRESKGIKGLQVLAQLEIKM